MPRLAAALETIMLLTILSHTPLWVWCLFTALLGLGLWQRRSRHVKPAQLLILPIMLLTLGLWGMLPAFSATPWLALFWLKALALGAALGRRLPVPAGTRWMPEAGTSGMLHLAGSWVPMFIIVTIFLLRYTTGVALALHPEWRTMAQVQVPMALAFGALSGMFLGRAITLFKLTRQAGRTISGHGIAHAA